MVPSGGRRMTRYIAAYDTESPKCLNAVRTIVDVHKRHQMSATFFIVARTLEANVDEYRELLDDPLFEIASHSYSHKLLRDHPLCGDAASSPEIEEEIVRSKEYLETVFEREVPGFRTPVGFVDGLSGASDVLKLVDGAGYRYVSSMAWGKDYSLPAPLTQPRTHAEDGFPDLWELPTHGWHENLLKDNNKWGASRLTLWPPYMPEAIPNDFVSTPEDEFAVHRVFLDRAKKDELAFVSLIWHPWSLGDFDPEMLMIDMVFSHVADIGLKKTTYAELLTHMVAG